MARQLPSVHEHSEFLDEFGPWSLSYQLGRTARGLLVIRQITIAPTSGTTPTSSATEIFKARYQPVPGRGIDWRVLRRLPLGGALRYARAVIQTQDPRGDLLTRKPKSSGVVGRPLSRPRPFWTSFARRYQALAASPRVLVQLAEEFDLKYSTARGIVARCRTMGLIGPSGRTRRRRRRAA